MPCDDVCLLDSAAAIVIINARGTRSQVDLFALLLQYLASPLGSRVV